jgi:hypothetical protein
MLLLHGFDGNRPLTLLLPAQWRLTYDGVDVGRHLHGQVPPLSTTAMTTLLLCCPPPSCLTLSTPTPLSLCCPLPPRLAPPPLPPPSCHIVRHLPTAWQFFHCLFTASSYPPCLLSLSCPLPALDALSMRTLPPSLLPQPSPLQQMRAPILVKKATAFATAVVPLLVQGT